MKRILLLLVLLLVTLISLSACVKLNKNPSISEPTIASIIDQNTSKPIVKSQKFKPNDPAVYFTIKTAAIPKDTTIKALWRHIENNTEIPSQITASGSGYEVFTLKRNSSLFPTGHYEVTASAIINNKTLELKGNFEVVNDVKATYLFNPQTSRKVDNDDKLTPTDITSEFTQSDPVIYFVIQSKDLPKDTKISCSWVYLDSGDSLHHELITDGNRNIAFSLKPEGSQKLPSGKYVVTASAVIENETESVSSEFIIK